MLFETKKVPLETLGEYLSEVRANLGLSLSEVASATGIGERYLVQLEAGKYHNLPPDVYIFGFLKKLADLYAVPADTLLQQYKKERGIIDQVASPSVPAKGLKGRLGRLVVTPKLITLASVGALVIVALGYLVFQVSTINRTPSLTIFEPAAGSIVKGTVINVKGEADPGSTVAINGQNVFVDAQGKFEAALSAAIGQKELAITAQNKFGKQTEKKIVVVVEDPSITQLSPTVLGVTTSLNLELRFSRATTIEINTDEAGWVKEKVLANETKLIEASRQIVVKTTDAGSIQASLNGKDLGVLGRDRESLTIPFTAESITNPSNNN